MKSAAALGMGTTTTKAVAVHNRFRLRISPSTSLPLLPCRARRGSPLPLLLGGSWPRLSCSSGLASWPKPVEKLGAAQVVHVGAPFVVIAAFAAATSAERKRKRSATAF